MSCSSRSLLFLLQRCVAVRHGTLGRCGFIQQRAWASTPRAVCQLQSAVRTSQYSFCTKAGEPFEYDYPPLPPYQIDPEPDKVYIIRVRGIPYSCSTQDVLQFFSDCRIRDGTRGIHLMVNRQGRPTGEAFIEVEHEEDVKKAMERHRQYLGPRYVEVYELTDNEAEAILKRAIIDKDLSVAPDHGVVRIRGLPFSSTEDDVAQFFSGLDIVENGITIIMNNQGKHSGVAFVKFSSQEAAKEALLRDKQNMGNRYIEVFPSSEHIYASWRKRVELDSPQTPSPQMPDHQTLDHQMPEAQTLDPQMLYTSWRKKVELDSPQTPSPQMPDHQMLDHQTLDPQMLYTSWSKKVELDSPQTPSPQMPDHQMLDHQMLDHQTLNPQMLDPQMLDHQTLDHQTLNPQMLDPQMLDHQTLDHQTLNPQMLDPQMLDHQTLNPQMLDPQMLDHQTLNHQTLNPQMLDPQMLDHQTLDPQMPDPQMLNHQMPEAQMPDPQMPDPQMPDPQMPDPQSEISSTVSPKPTRSALLPSPAPQLHFIHMRGLPFQVSGEDILKFFAPLRVSKILLECSPKGGLSGEGDVYFRDHQDALSAMSRDGQHIGQRYIELFLNSEED